MSVPATKTQPACTFQWSQSAADYALMGTVWEPERAYEHTHDHKKSGTRKKKNIQHYIIGLVGQVESLYYYVVLSLINMSNIYTLVLKCVSENALCKMVIFLIKQNPSINQNELTLNTINHGSFISKCDR